MNRREFVGVAATGVALAGGAATGRSVLGDSAPAQPDIGAGENAPKLKGRVKHSACRWCYGSMKLEELCVKAKAVGVRSIELLNEKEWPVAAAHGMECAVAMGPTQIGKGFNRTENHDAFVKEGEQLLPLVKAAGIPNMIVFSGNRGGKEAISDEEGLKNCAEGLKRLTPLAESLGVTIIMELLNSKVDHKDYQCDRTPWGVELVKRVGSDRFKLLYDIYHMQIMEGDVIRTITDNLQHIAHFHTGGVPGRNEIDGRQELNYRRIVEAIHEKGYTGYIGQEFVPTGDAMVELGRAVAICDV